MKSGCEHCGASGVWVGLAEVTRRRGALVFTWVCRHCEHRWTITSARIDPPKATLSRPRRRRRRA